VAARADIAVSSAAAERADARVRWSR